MKIANTLLALVTLTGLILSAPASAADSFSSGQTQQIQQVVRDYLLKNPDILIEMSQKLQEKQEQQIKSLQDNASKAIPGLAKDLLSSTSPAGGNLKGNVSVIEFFDYQCPHCKDMTPVVEKLINQDKNVKVIYKEFPIFGASSVYASKAALAANIQGKYMAMHDALMNADNPLTEQKVIDAARTVGLNVDKLKKDMDSDAVKQELNTNLKLAQQLGLMGTPAFVIADSTKASQANSLSFFIPGATTTDVIVGYIQQIRGK